MTLESLSEIIAFILIVVGSLFIFSTAIGMIRFPDFYTRLHAGSKCLVGGGVSTLIGCIILKGPGFISLKLIVIIAFLIISNPVAIHAIARSAHKYGIKPKNAVKDDLQEKRG